MRQNPWSKFDPYGLVDANFTRPGSAEHTAFEKLKAPPGAGLFTVGGHAEYAFGPVMSDDRNARYDPETRKYVGQDMSPEQLVVEMQRRGYKNGTPGMIIGCTSGWGDETSLAAQVAVLTGAPFAGATKDVYLNSDGEGGNGVPTVYGSIPDPRGGFMPNNQFNGDPGHMQWFDPDGNPIHPEGWTPVRPDKGYTPYVYLVVPEYVTKYMEKWKQSKKTVTDSVKPAKAENEASPSQGSNPSRLESTDANKKETKK